MTFQIKDAAGNAVTVNPIPPVGPAAKAASLPMTLSPDDPAVQHLSEIVAALVPVGLQYSDASVTLDAAQAAGTKAILPANPARKALIIVPPSASVLTIAGNLATGIPLLGSTPNPLAPSICPTNQLFVRGLNVNDVVTILQA
jgi:hypothetical protein